MGLTGYACIRTDEGCRVLGRQAHALNATGRERVLVDCASGPAADRPNPAACHASLRCGDVLVLHDIDRLSRPVGELIPPIDERYPRGAGLRAVNPPTDTTTLTGRTVLQIRAAFAETERNVVRQRAPDAVKAARARECEGGRSRTIIPEEPRNALNLTVDRTGLFPDILREPGDIPEALSVHSRTPTGLSQIRAGGRSARESVPVPRS